jgi:ATP-dependent RNA helicase DeaD
MTDSFELLGLQPELLQALSEAGYTQPTPIQASAIPALLAGQDVIGQAQTGTGKTAAFALPMLQLIDTDVPRIQALVLTPTRELAAQVATAIHTYGKYRNARVLPIYGGASYDRQLKRLERGAHVVIGTPGRVLDLLSRGALDFSTVTYAVLDEADEMLKMGFIDDVEAILSAVPEARQTALFSATFSDQVRELTHKYMRDPQTISMQRERLAVPLIEQRYYMIHEEYKLAALCRLLETEELHSALIFTRTRVGSAELAEQLLERGFMADALHGELNQPAREAVLRRFRGGQLPILVATDVVARGVDISEVSHVFNYDIPYDPEDYVHRIGRTGRAGRSGVAIMLVTPRERRRLGQIEDYTRQPIRRATLPEIDEVLARRDQRFGAQLTTIAGEEDLSAERDLLAQMVEAGHDLGQIAAAAVRMARLDDLRRPLDVIPTVRDAPRREGGRYERSEGRSASGERGRQDVSERRGGRRFADTNMVRLLVDLGHKQGVRPGDIVGTIAGEAGIPGKAIGAIDIQQNRTFVDVNADHVERVLALHKRFLKGKPMNITRAQ